MLPDHDIKILESFSRIKMLKKDFVNLYKEKKRRILITSLKRPCVLFLFRIHRRGKIGFPEPELLGSRLEKIDHSNLDYHIDMDKNNWVERSMRQKEREKAQEQAVKDKLEGYNFHVYKDDLYCVDSESYTEEEQRLLIKEYYFKKEKKFKSLQKEIHLFEKLDVAQGQSSREPIPEDVRFAVWRRDEGKCVKCGSKENLEFDHIIPVSKGGSNTERNIQLLCERCNREKYNKI